MADGGDGGTILHFPTIEVAPPIDEPDFRPQPPNPEHSSPAAEALLKARSLIDGDRDRQHGNRLECCMKIALMWNAWDSVKRVPHSPDTEFDVAIKMGMVKLVRTQMGIYNDDDMPDGLGYFAIAAEFLPALSPK